MSKKKIIGGALLVAFFYTLLFFFVSNYSHWYFNGEFLYEELLGDTGYLMYNWLDNTVTTVAMVALIFLSECVRNLIKN